MWQIIWLALSLLVAGPVWAQTTAKSPARLTDAQIKQAIIKASIAGYAGSCPCPYNTDRAGRSCGRRSAYSRPGGAAPLCYVADVTKEMVAAYRAERGEKLPAEMPAADVKGSTKPRK